MPHCRPRSFALLVVATLTLAACQSQSADEQTIAAAMAHVTQSSEDASAKVHATERMRALQAKVEADAAQAKADAYAALVRVPDEIPASLDAACDEATAAYDAFVTQRLEGAAKQRWEVTKSVDLAQLGKACRKHRDRRIAGCEAQALREAGPLFTADDAPFIVAKCEELSAAPEHA